MQITEKEKRDDDSGGMGMTNFEKTMNKELLDIRASASGGAGAAVANLGSSTQKFDEEDLQYIQDALAQRVEATSPPPLAKNML